MAINKTTGGWFYQDSTNQTVVTFFDNGTFFLVQNTTSPSAASIDELPGIEKGTYTLSDNTFRVSSIELDTNGKLGLSSFIGLNLPYTYTSDSINVAGQITLSKITSSTNSLVGSWYGTNLGDAKSNAVITFLNDGSYFMAEDGDSLADSSGHDGMEKGTYSWNSQNGSFSAKTLVDTTGEWGLSHVNYPLSVSLTGDKMNFSGLSLNRVGDTATVSNPVSSNPTNGNGAIPKDTYNLITGTDKDDSIRGTNSKDIITGGLGKDTLTGGKDADIFKYVSVKDSGITTKTRDKITDFQHNEKDKIDLSSIDANEKLAGDQAFKFIGSSAFSKSDATGQLRFDSKQGVLYGSTDKDSAAEFSIQLSGIKSLVADDIVL